MAKAKPSPVRDVADALEHGDPEVALGAAIAAWRDRRHAVLADAIDAIAARCTLKPIAGRDKESYQRAWLDHAKRASDDPVARSAVLAGLLKSMPVREVRYLAQRRDVKRYKHFLARIDALATCEPDPRTATALLDVLVRAPFSVDDCAGVFGPVIDLLIRIGDERSVEQLRALVERPVANRLTLRDYFAEALPKAADQIERGLRRRDTLSPADRALALAISGTPKPAATPRRIVDLDSLLAECLANPDDESPRLVYADALLERDDARGEFIQLQLRDNPDEAAQKRIASLQRKHEKQWLGDIVRVTKCRLFRRGFLDEAELLQGAAADAATWQRVARDPRMATVRTLHKGSASEQLYKSFAFSAALRSLRDIVVPTTKLLRELPAIGRPIDRITLSAGLTREALDLLDGVAKKTGVRCLAFETKQTPAGLVAQMAAWPIRARFDELCAIPHRSTGDAWTDELPWLTAFDKLAPVRRLGVGSWHGRVVVERTDKGLVVDITARQEHSIVSLLSKQLPARIVRLVVRGKPDAWSKPTAAFGKAIARLPASVVELREGWANL